MSSILQAAALIARSRNLVIFTGAGVSADSGVPTFRGPASESFWGQYSAEQLATPEGFRADPKLVYDWYTWRRSQLCAIEPNAAHQAIARWQKDSGAVVITQNIDGLHERLAPPHAEILRLHGTLAEDCCSGCDHREPIDFAALPPLRHCPQCAGWLRPAVVWFGEPLDPDIWSRAHEVTERADVFLVVGTSGQVWPAAGLVQLAARRADVIVVNLEASSLDELATHVFHGRAAEVVPGLAGAAA